MTLVLLVLSILPVFVLGRYIYNMDFEKEPKGLLISLFLMGLGSVVVTTILTEILEGIFPFFEIENQNKVGVIGLIPYIFIGVALIEEFSKWIFVYFFSYHHREFNHAYDAIVYAVFVSLGFACLENIFYVFSYGIETAIVRAITAVPGHACFGVLMGFYFGMAKTADKHQNREVSKRNKIKSLLFPILAHGMYDYFIFASAEVSFFVILFIAFVVLLFNNTMDKVKQLVAIRYDIGESSFNLSSIPVESRQYSYRYCPMCGNRVIGKFCQNCGHRHWK